MARSASAPLATPRPGPPPPWAWHSPTALVLPQVLPKLSSSIVHEIDSILGNKPYSKKDYRS